MNMQEIRKMAKDMDLKLGKMTKMEAIRAIQLAEGYSDCFGREGNTDCSQEQCLFRSDCLPSSKKSN